MTYLIYTCFVLISLGISVWSTCLDSSKKNACDAVFNPNAMKYRCCKPMNAFITNIKSCQDQSGSDMFSCPVSVCVVRDKYNLTDDEGNIVEAKCRVLLDQLDKEDPTTKPMNQRIRDNCLNDGYKRYVTSDPNCDTMKYQVCCFVNYLLGCDPYYSSPDVCATESQNVETCRPVCNQYLDEINCNCC